MSDAVKEQLSAVLDGELAEAELDLLLKRLERDADLGETLSRYALCSQAMKGEGPPAASTAFAANVMAALQNEPPLARRAPRWRVSPAVAQRLRPVAGAAVAASVAALAVFSIQETGMEPGSTEQPAPQFMASAEPDPSYTVPATTPTTAFVPAARLTNYVVAHAEFSSPLGRRSVLSGVLSEDDLELIEPAADSGQDAEGMMDTKVTHP
jgi:sigma-E factor negative regulatory protein RseA